MKKKLFSAVFTVYTVLLLLPITASALTIDGANYNKTMQCAQTTDSFTFERYNTVRAANSDNGHTANLIGAPKAIPSYGYWYNAAIGYDKSYSHGAGAWVNGNEVVRIKATGWQMNNVNTVGGYRGDIRSPYRGLTRSIKKDYYADSWRAGHRRLVVFWSLPDNSVYGDIRGLDDGDKANARISITGTGLPNKTSYGSGEKYNSSGITSVGTGSAKYGNYYISAYIPNAHKYDITYSVYYTRGSKYENQGNDISNNTYRGSGSFSTNSYYVESGGYLSVTVNVKKKGTVIADLHKGTGVTESYAGKSFNLYNSSGSYVGQATTGSNGYAYFYNQTHGSYTIKPAGTPTNHYYNPTSVSVGLYDDTALGKFTLYRSKGTLKIKYNTEDSMSRNGVKFKVTNPNGTVSYHYTDSGGCITLPNVITGSYKVEQLSVPNDYKGVRGVQTVTVHRSSTTTITFYNPILYDFAVRVSAPRTVEQMQPFTGKITFINKGGKPAVNVPVQVKYSGRFIYNTTISISANGRIVKEFSLNTSTVDPKRLWASINASRAKYEKNLADNYDSHIISVTTSTNLQIEFIPPNSDYREGMEVISSFRVKNDGFNHVTPADSLKVGLTVSYTQNGASKRITVPDKHTVIIPYGGDNIVFFKWKVPNDTAGLLFKLTATVNPDYAVTEKNYKDNTVVIYRTIASLPYSVTPDTKFEKKQPSGFTNSNPPTRYGNPSAVWSVWEWEKNWFVRKTYGLQINPSSSLSITPDPKSPSREYKNGQWMMRSGYGLSLDYSVYLQNIRRYNKPGTTMYTPPQSATAYFPEFKYSPGLGRYRTLTRNGTNHFTLPNSQYGRLHFVPLWFPNGDYTVQTCVSEIWTPTGMLWSYSNSKPIKISESAFDDWYIGK